LKRTEKAFSKGTVSSVLEDYMIGVLGWVSESTVAG